MSAPRTGLEPVTYGLTVRRSTYWTNEEYNTNYKNTTNECTGGLKLR